ncbi:MAG: methyltransferase [Ruminococcus sp.]|nr:methyltransferase [Ruminococcus sp.]
MNNDFFESAKNVLSLHLNKNTKVIDLMCGESVYSDWIKYENNAQTIPLTPEDLEHIKSENPFVAYNNFINDSRMLPTQGGKADVVILMGPLYSMQNTQERAETLNEVKRLLAPNGKVITVCRQNYLQPYNNTQNNSDEKCEFENAGFEIDSITPMPYGISENYKNGKTPKQENSDKFFAVATAKQIPEPAISKGIVPPDIVIDTPKQKKINYYSSEQTSYNIENKPAYISTQEIKSSIDLSLQNRKHIAIKPSIDSSLQIKSSVISNTAFTNCSDALNDVIKHSADSSFVESNIQIPTENVFRLPRISMADTDINSIEKRLREIRHRLPILPKEILENYASENTEELSSSESELNSDTTTEIESGQADNNSNTENILAFEDISDKQNTLAKASVPVAQQTSEKFGLTVRPSIDKKLVYRKGHKKLLSVQKSIDENLVIRSNKEDIINKHNISAKQQEKIEELRKVHPSIEKALQIRIKKINPKYAKKKSRKKGTGNLIKY